MRAVVQRVSEANVQVDGERVGQVRPEGPGLVVLLAAGDGDDEGDSTYLAKKIVGLRVFEDEEGRMNRSIDEVGGSLLIISQFTLFGDCRKGRRPSFVHAMEPVGAEALVEHFVGLVRAMGIHAETGRFRTHMDVSLVNDGPVTLLIDSRKTF